MRRVLAVVLMFMLVGWLNPGNAAHAARFVSDQEVWITEDVDGDLYAIGNRVVVKGNVYGDLYVMGDRVDVEGEVHGDLFAVGAEVNVRGTVNGDAFLFGQIVRIAGSIQDDIRGAGMVMLVKGPEVDGDVIVAGNVVAIEPEAPVGGDVAAAGSRVYLKDVSGNVWAAGNGITIAGHIGGNVQAAVGEGKNTVPSVWDFLTPNLPEGIPPVEPGLTLTREARVDGNLMYESFQPVTIAPGAVVRGETLHRLPERRQQKTPLPEARWGTRPWLVEQARYWLTLFLVGLVAFLIGGRRWRDLSRQVVQRPLGTLGWGVVLFLGGVGVVVVLFLATVLGAILFGLLTLKTLSVWTLAIGLAVDVVVALTYVLYTTLLAPSVVGYGALARLDRNKYTWVALLAGSLLLYVVLGSLPRVGWVVKLLVAVMGLGAGWVYRRELRAQARRPPEAASAEA